MKRIKEYNFCVNDGNKTIRFIKNIDLEYYKNWYRIGHILSDKVNDLSEEFIAKMMFGEIKMHLILIIEIDQKPIGEITIWDDVTLIIQNKDIKKPFYSIMIKFYDDVIDEEINMIIKLFINSIKCFKLKAGTIYTMIDINIEPNYENNYVSNGFQYFNKEYYKSKLEESFKRNGVENPYDKLKMLIKRL